MTIKPKIGTCTICNKTDKPLMKKMCCDGYMSCYEKQRWARYNEKKKAKEAGIPKAYSRPIAKRSKKEALRQAKYVIAKAEHLKEYPTCQFPGCNESRYVSVHHSKGRIGDLLWDKRYFKTLCVFPGPDHHTRVENNPEEAKELGLSVSRLENVA